ncbi:MAG TPA: tripartite tricarboxylate transporter substrate-binding protein [Burkholderiales bacterium]|nr:tripartite tricarboxylate transporter substrate-binding protein [Burkholderiales bacterium]
MGAILRWLTGACAAAVLSVAGAAAQSFPQKPLKFVVGFAPGGTADTVARIAADALSGEIGMAVVVENRAGAGGTIAATSVAAAAADGYTLLVNATSDVINPIINKRAGYDIETSFVPIGLLASSPNALVVPASLAAASAKGLAEAGRAHSGALNYGSAGIGTVSHLAGALFCSLAHVRCVHIPYKGTAAAQIDLLGGRLDFMFDGLASAQGNARAGNVRMLAVTSAQRWPAAREVPGMAESGYPGFDMLTWFGLLAPAATPAPVVSRISEALVRGLRNPEVRQRIATIGAQAGGMTQAEFARYIRAEKARWRKLFADGLVRVDE